MSEMESTHLGLSVIIPAFNEESRIENTLICWKRYLEKSFPDFYEVMVMMDACSDKTVQLVLNLSTDWKQLVPIISPVRLGKGGALIEAFKHSRGDTLFFTDADGALDPSELKKFIAVRKSCDFVTGSRYFKNSNFSHSLPFRRIFFSRVFNLITKSLFPEMKGIRDTQCGAKALSKKLVSAVITELFIKDFVFDINLILASLHHGFSIEEISIEYHHSDDESKITKNLSRISLAMFLSLLKLRIYHSRFRKIAFAESICSSK